jgi:hypothetical protein
MVDYDSCEFCGLLTKDDFPESSFAVCSDCADAYRDVLASLLDINESELWGFALGLEAVDREYVPEDGELMYLATRSQTYQVELRDEWRGKIIYLQPEPDNDPAQPITQLADELAHAIDNEKFYRWSANEIVVGDHETWWESALALAPMFEDFVEDIQQSKGDEFDRQQHSPDSVKVNTAEQQNTER